MYFSARTGKTCRTKDLSSLINPFVPNDEAGPARPAPQSQLFSNELPGVVIDERVLVYDSGTADVAQDVLDLSQAEIWNLMVLVIPLSSLIARDKPAHRDRK